MRGRELPKIRETRVGGAGAILHMMSQREPVQVLAVDDDAAFVEMLGKFLELEDEYLSITTASCATDGLHLLRENEFDCVVSDLEMPEMNGLEFLRTVRQRWDGLPFIMFTGHGEEEIATKARAAGVTEYLQKQMGTDQYADLAEVVRDAV